MTFVPVREPVEASLVAEQLERLEPLTQFRGLTVYQFSGDECPAAMEEVGRIREQVFRREGAGRGESIDVDSLDYGSSSYGQLVAFDQASRRIVSMLRFQWGARFAHVGADAFRTTTLFRYSQGFRDEVLPRGVELGRSVVDKTAPRSEFGLFALWRGLAQLARSSRSVDYFFGNVTIYRDYPQPARDVLVATIEEMYAPPEPMLRARSGLRLVPRSPPQPPERSWSVEEGVKHVSGVLADRGAELPPMLAAYLSLSTEIWCGETARDADFGDALEMAIVVPLRSLRSRSRRLFGLDVSFAQDR